MESDELDSKFHFVVSLVTIFDGIWFYYNPLNTTSDIPVEGVQFHPFFFIIRLNIKIPSL